MIYYCLVSHQKKQLITITEKFITLPIRSVRRKHYVSNYKPAVKPLSIIESLNLIKSEKTTYRQCYSLSHCAKSLNFCKSKLLKKNLYFTQRCNIGSIGKEDAPLTKTQADDLILRLTEDERKALLSALQEYNSNQVKAEYEGQLAATRWRSKFGRPSKLPTLGDVDPTGSYCHLPEDCLKNCFLTEKVPLPTGQQLMRVAIFNAVPFVGFGFLDNFVMIVAGDYIDETLGSLVTISTMAAAALGNTISDVMGIGSAWYVELAASKVGLKPPNLSPIQLDMKPARRAANLGRAMGIIVGCLLGMLPLLFISKDDGKKKEKV
ncbi:conserved hypothetical protein [Pediculus humanus corporis]|uniref:Transmembrane protein 65 n=1 Tax=Pediculus humanus subsp. corporis TaxID=121224 RepID=E0VQ09_PEDHC|nr:uncharacterized protein Phum_PHUM369820 [Pediculus humanus corporis]EEB15465.1 conserved hypothetical protein [Pediculus humanus corporis]